MFRDLFIICKPVHNHCLADWQPVLLNNTQYTIAGLCTVQFHYSIVNFLENNPNKPTITRPWGWGMGLLWSQCLYPTSAVEWCKQQCFIYIYIYVHMLWDWTVRIKHLLHNIHVLYDNPPFKSCQQLYVSCCWLRQVHDCGISIADVLEIQQSSAWPSIYVSCRWISARLASENLHCWHTGETAVQHLANYICIMSMATCKSAVSPLLMHWRYCSLALSHCYLYHVNG